MPFYNFSEFNNKTKTRTLVIGQVQSGKTRWIEDRIVHSIKQNFDFCIVYGGTTNLLTDQTKRRFIKSQQIKENNEVIPKIINIENIKKNNSGNYFQKNNLYFPIVVILKGKSSLDAVNNFIDNISLKSKKILIVDDESDFASINNSKDSTSKIHECVEKIFNKTSCCEFFQITATPFANIVSQSFDEILWLEPNLGYTGSDFFLKNNKYKIINAKKSDVISCNNSIDETLSMWLVSTAKYLLETNIDNKSEFLINIDLKKPKHDEIKKTILDLIEMYQRYPNNLNLLLKKSISFYSEKLNELKILSTIGEIISYLIANDSVIILNSDKDFVYKSGMFKYCILIGGTKISRGFTFEHLITELLLNAPKEKAAIDTLLQRARWFGYRHKYDDMQKYMSVFMNKNIYDLYVAADKTINFLGENYTSSNLKNDIINFCKSQIYGLNMKLTNKRMGNT